MRDPLFGYKSLHTRYAYINKFQRLIILYGSETWALRKSEEVRFDKFERKVLRRIYGQYHDPQTEKWRIRNNEEIHNLN